MTKQPNRTTNNRKSQPTTLRVAELFAGVGGFRIGLDRATKKVKKEFNLGFETIWSNQWEPATKRQHASEVYVARFGTEGHSNEDISKVSTEAIPDHDLLVGGFPCQDYSVARTLSHAAGLTGKKGVLWWEIHRILKEKGAKAPKYLLLENVDRLIKSPASARGRDFSIMLSSLASLGYVVEWRVINAADYGKPQRRRRIFILGYKNNTNIAKAVRSTHAKDWLTSSGVVVDNFKILPTEENLLQYELGSDPVKISESFEKLFPEDISYANSGLMVDGKVWTIKVTPHHLGKKIVLEDILVPEDKVPTEYFIPKTELAAWKYLKGGKKETRETKGGFKYFYSEGPVAFPDKLNQPSRTIITGEGGAGPSRFKHVVLTPSGKYRRLLPVELELLSQFPAEHTNVNGISDAKRAFFIGNALVVGIIEDMGKALIRSIKRYEQGDFGPASPVVSDLSLVGIPKQ